MAPPHEYFQVATDAAYAPPARGAETEYDNQTCRRLVLEKARYAKPPREEPKCHQGDGLVQCVPSVR